MVGGQLHPSLHLPLPLAPLGFLTAWPSQGGQEMQQKPQGILLFSLEDSRKSAKVLSIAAMEKRNLQLL